MKKGLYVTILGGIVAALLIFGCDFLLGPDEPVGAGNLVIGFGESGGAVLASASRAVVPTAEEQAAPRYKLVLTGPGGQIKTVSLSPGKTFNEQVALGKWRIEAKAYDSGDALIGRGSATVTVRAGKNEARVAMRVVTITETVAGVAYTLRPVPAGTVTVSIGKSGGPFYDAETTPVTVSAFYMGETEITYELWETVRTWATDPARGANVYTFASPGRQGGDSGSGPVGTDQHPVTTISWRDAVVWCNAYSEAVGKTPVYYLAGTDDFSDTTKVLRESEGNDVSAGNSLAEKAVTYGGADGFRLPTEAEWEYAARGGVPGTGTPWTYTYTGSNTIDDVAVYDDNSGSQTTAVKSKTGGTYNGANSLGLSDLSGNVREWCWDVFAGAYRVVRGGSWSNGASDCEVADRSNGYPYARTSGIGFRVVCP
jgi:formylglycine-generating enzyme required for sulfatase activity